uniref:Uncharacterized protein n=1 Tax=Rangifer tarandus platyrhynchus TaxID=3082113 RepID=A0ACB0EX27_RANTA|nr:unnamed protein product [Rangifer tarandus platyrhynchus]
MSWVHWEGGRPGLTHPYGMGTSLRDREGCPAEGKAALAAAKQGRADRVLPCRQKLTPPSLCVQQPSWKQRKKGALTPTGATQPVPVLGVHSQTQCQGAHHGAPPASQEDLPVPAGTTVTHPGARGPPQKAGSEPSAERPFDSQGHGRGLLPTPHLTELCGQSASGGGSDPSGQHGTEGRGSRKDSGPRTQDVAADARLGPTARSARPQREAQEDHHREETSFPSQSPNMTHSSC